jgi:Tol biopolymer transport system component
MKPRRSGLFAAVSCAAAAGFAAVLVGSGAGPAPARAATDSEFTNIFLVPAAGGKPIRLTNNREAIEEKLAYDPTFSPNGKRLAFTEVLCHSCTSEIHVIRARPAHGAGWMGRAIAYGYHPRWSPNGKLLAYVGIRGGIYVIRPDGSHRRLVTKGGLADDGPTWSPDSKRIAFTRQVTASRWRLYVVKVGGSGLRPLTSGSIPAVNPSWSPNGRRIAFAQERGRWQLVTMSLDGRARKTVSNGRASDSFPVWSPNGRRLVFVRQEGSSTAVFTIGANGGGLKRMSPRAMFGVEPTWTPNGRYVAFAGATKSSLG